MASDGRPPFGAGAWAPFGASVMFQCPLVARTPRGHGGQAAPRGDTATQGCPHAAHTTPAPGGNPFHPMSPSRAFGRAAQLSALRQPCAGIVDPLGLEGVSQHPTWVPVPWVAPPVGTGPPRLQGTSLAVVCPGRKHGPSTPFLDRVCSVRSLAVRWVTLLSCTWTSKDAAAPVVPTCVGVL